jgi:hypothetical protein
MRYSTTVNFLNGKINKIMSAIRGEWWILNLYMILLGELWLHN